MPPQLDRHPPFTPQQYRVIRFAAQGLVVPKMAAEMGVTYHTAKSHMQAVLKLADAVSQAQAVARTYALWPETFEGIETPEPNGVPRLLHLKLFARICTGHTYATAGAELYFSEVEVKSRVRDAREILGVATNPQAVYSLHVRGYIKPRSVIR